MTNHLKMAKVNTILELHRQGWSNRRIAAELGVHRDTVARHVKSAIPKQATAPTGSDDPKQATAPSGSGDSKQAIAPTGSSDSDRAEAGSPKRSQSDCGPYEKQIITALKEGLTAKRIHQDLVEDGFEGSYYSVRRFVKRLGENTTAPFRRLEAEPGQEAQVDFGTGARVQQEGRKRKTHVLRVVLSHSRRGYSEVVFHQTTENFVRCIENAFRHFRGSTKTLVIDNLRAAVKRVDWFEPEINPKVEEFCRHYNTVILPTRPRMPRHKGKVEKGIDYVQSNALKGRVFDTLEQQNAHLLKWETMGI